MKLYMPNVQEKRKKFPLTMFFTGKKNKIILSPREFKVYNLKSQGAIPKLMVIKY